MEKGSLASSPWRFVATPATIQFIDYHRDNSRFISTGKTVQFYEGTGIGKQSTRFGEFSVRLIDGDEVRNLGIKDEDFGDWATNAELPIIPTRQVWVNSELDESERSIATSAGLAFLKGLRSRSASSKVAAWKAAERVERKMRGKANKKHPKTPPPEVYDDSIFPIDDGRVLVWFVDGDVVRDLYYDDWIEGGNHERYPWIPEGQIWIERGQEDWPVILLHEFVECVAMRDGMKYDPAHMIASRLEYDYRPTFKANDARRLTTELARELIRAMSDSRQLHEVTDASGHEHKGKGPGGGEFTSKGQGGASGGGLRTEKFVHSGPSKLPSGAENALKEFEKSQGEQGAKQAAAAKMSDEEKQAKIEAFKKQYHTERAMKKLSAAIEDSAVDFPKRKHYHDVAASVLETMSAIAVERFNYHINSAKFFKNVDELTQYVDAIGGKKTVSNIRVGGVYMHGVDRNGEAIMRLALDGGAESEQGASNFDNTQLMKTSGYYAHEFGHAVDGPNFELSSSDEWKAAYGAEIDRDGDPLSRYARTHDSEGFAEYARLVHENPALAKKQFPLCWRAWKKWGLISTEHEKAANI